MNRAKIYLDWFRKDCTKQIKKQLPNYDLIKLSFLSLFYNHFLTQSYAIDTLLEPVSTFRMLNRQKNLTDWIDFNTFLFSSFFGLSIILRIRLDRYVFG